jgi:prepilin-type N-terminal cleavage/methylation domain-containing protein
MTCPTRRAKTLGFSLIELIAVIVLVSILSATVASKAMPRAAESTAGYQALSLASDLRHTQLLAMSWGRALAFTPASTSYSVTCVAASTDPCFDAVTPVLDRGRDGPFTVTLENGATLTGAAIQFDILGQPSASATFTLSADGATVATVSVSATTGFVTVN